MGQIDKICLSYPIIMELTSDFAQKSIILNIMVWQGLSENLRTLNQEWQNNNTLYLYKIIM